MLKLIVSTVIAVALLAPVALLRQDPGHCATCVGASPCAACKNCASCKFCAGQGGKCGTCRKR